MWPASSLCWYGAVTQWSSATAFRGLADLASLYRDGQRGSRQGFGVCGSASLFTSRPHRRFLGDTFCQRRPKATPPQWVQLAHGLRQSTVIPCVNTLDRSLGLLGLGDALGERRPDELVAGTVGDHGLVDVGDKCRRG